jgi:putative ATP-dependent endonuclease of OLD family
MLGVRINQVRVRNFRCLENVEIGFEDVTTFLGPNGAGKSTILHALNWFFNGTKQNVLTVEDVFHRQSDLTVEVSVRFDALTERDREALGKYASTDATTVEIRKTWTDGVEKTIGRSRVLPAFEEVRSGASAGERKAAYAELRSAQPALGLPAWTNDAAAAQVMSEWEAANTTELVEADVESASHFFGFAGQALLSGVFDFIFVSADLRAGEETTDGRGAIIGRILEQAIDRTAADAEIAEVLAEASRGQSTILEKHFTDQLADLSAGLTTEVGAFASGRSIEISSELTPPPPQKTQFHVNVIDRELKTRVDRQGHGFQRALLIAALKLLAEARRTGEMSGVICLAVEEPELYQHPLQARLFAAVLRSLAEDASRGVQVTYATHSPYFIEARSFSQIRRVTRSKVGDHDATRVLGSAEEAVTDRLDGFVEAERIRRQLDGVCLGGLSEGFFADVVLLVEGSTDRAVLAGAAARDASPLLLDGIFVGEAGGKTGLLLPYVIFEQLGIPVYVVADNDSHLEEMREAASQAGDLPRVKNLKDSVADSIRWNRIILRFFGLTEEDWPTGSLTSRLTFVDGGLEQALAEQWPAWAATRQELIESGEGFSGKDQATYEEAALQAPGEVPVLVTALIASARALKAAA